ncbi:type II toxin-antitoxin system HipA family toxin [Rhizobium sp. SEMIA 4085]|uniref:type II toxin-antitoxin system HipA family toxin n=1 Tax=Rhizobium sp. SEMIA 4085 TaxID=2137761 RepID=UPI001478BC46|nr:type II toxin-antitoxin system HipA family toxin [Rhizobium sp. SEMIA 4085]NNH27981.1 type II toxin-antitoxin system HipA family toxin [Rhizobium sp. SEMIA 4085]
MTTIYYENWPVAYLTDDDGLSLAYDAEWEKRQSAFPLSLTMPLREGSHGPEKVLPWLANLLPEAHLSEIGQQLKVSPQDVLGLLMRVGRDTAGAFSIGEPRRDGNNFRVVDDAEALERIINELPERPFLIGERGVSMSLAGVQDKLPVFINADGRIAIPLDGTPSTHILKPDIRRLAGSVTNEAFCMTLARLCGLEAAEVTTGRAGERDYLLVRRYDRIADVQGIVRRIHQEDFCQLLGLFPAEKYEQTGLGRRIGASLPQMFEALARLVSPAERLRLLDAVIFNVLICNSDSHAKNYSVLIGASGTARLAPLYDLMCAAPYRQIDQSLPQRLGTRRNADELHGKDWRQFASDTGLSPAMVTRRVEELAGLVASRANEALTQVLSYPVSDRESGSSLAFLVKKRCGRIERQIRG